MDPVDPVQPVERYGTGVEDSDLFPEARFQSFQSGHSEDLNLASLQVPQQVGNLAETEDDGMIVLVRTRDVVGPTQNLVRSDTAADQRENRDYRD